MIYAQPTEAAAPQPGRLLQQHLARLRPALLALVVIAAPCAVAAAGTGPQNRAQTAQDDAYGAAATDTARVLAGLQPGQGSRLDRIVAHPAWRTHHAEFERNWGRLDAERFVKMREWRDRELKPVESACDTLFYPFGGPDFLNAFVLFPGCNRYLLFGLEPVGSIPALDHLADAEIDAVLTGLRASLSDIFLRDYFITKTMMSELRTQAVDGTLPLLLGFLARADARSVEVRMDAPWAGAGAAGGASGTPPSAPPRPRRPASVTVRFTLPGDGRVRTLVYSRVQMQDAAFSRQTAMLAYLDGVAPLTTLLKSASYLMHDDRFSRVRSLILTRSRAVLEDDTGVPFRFFDKAAWDLTLFGRYSRPVKDFNYGFQPDLEAAYHDASAAAHELPFSFGYHWKDGASSVILAIRRGAPAQQ